MSKYSLTDIYEEFRAGDKFSTDFDYDGMLMAGLKAGVDTCLLYTSPSPRDRTRSRMPSSA